MRRANRFAAYGAVAALAAVTGTAGVASRVLSAAKTRPYAVGGTNSLKLREHVADLSADGKWVAISSGDRAGFRAGCTVSFWRPDTKTWAVASSASARVGGCEYPATFGTWGWASLTLAGTRVAWADRGGGIQRWEDLHTNSRGHVGPELGGVASGHGCCAGLTPYEGTHIGDVVGQGKLLVYSTWTSKCVGMPCAGTTLTDEAVWRVVDGIGTCGATPDRTPDSPHCELVARWDGPLDPLDVDSGRVVVLRDTRSVELLDQSGTTLRAFPFTSGEPLGAVLSGRDLVVLVRGALEVYDADSGVLVHAWPVPDVPSGGHCRNVEGCPPVRLELDAAARGLVLYVLDRTVHLLRIADGRDVAVARAAAADLTASGLYYASAFSGPYPGRVRFIPYGKLPLQATA